jgi:hypothetical protein
MDIDLFSVTFLIRKMTHLKIVDRRGEENKNPLPKQQASEEHVRDMGNDSIFFTSIY